jgi:hypothetical protein
MKRITNILSLLAILGTILIGGATVGATVRDGQPSETPCGLRRMLQTLDAPSVGKFEVASAAREMSNARFN